VFSLTFDNPTIVSRMATESHRLSILSDQEIEDLYGLPKFTDEDRLLYFDLSPAEKTAAGAIKTASVAAFFIVGLGYFKAKCQFFSFEAQDVQDDLRFVVELYFPGRKLEDSKLPSRPSRGMLQKTVLDLCQYCVCGPAERTELEAKAQRIAMLSTQPVYILREMQQQLSIGRIVAPSYTSLQDIVGRVVSGERTRIIGLLNEALTPAVEQRLRSLLEADEQVYNISALKREAKDFTYGELRREVARRDFFESLHDFAGTFLVSAGLSQESSKYYGSLVKFYTVYKLHACKLRARSCISYVSRISVSAKSTTTSPTRSFIWWVNTKSKPRPRPTPQCRKRLMMHWKA